MTHCVGCGGTDCPGCKPELDPPRYCPTCGHRLTVRVTPTSVVARCRDHGVIKA